MKKPAKPSELGKALRGFFTDYLPKQKGAKGHTISSYRDSVKLLLCFLSARSDRAPFRLSFDAICVDSVLAFLNHLERERGNCIATRNSRLAAIHSFFRYVASILPDRLSLSQQILAIPFKHGPTRVIEYLEFDELKAVLAQIDRSTALGRCDYVLLTLMFNTGARVQEVVDIVASDLSFEPTPSVRIQHGKGNKERICPLWKSCADLLREYIDERGLDRHQPAILFRNHLGTPLTRFGVRYILNKYVFRAHASSPSLARKRIHPHSIRHSTAVHLLKSGNDLASIASWLGHASCVTTNKYATMDLDMKRAVIAKAAPAESADTDPTWQEDDDLLTWLESL